MWVGSIWLAAAAAAHFRGNSLNWAIRQPKSQNTVASKLPPMITRVLALPVNILLPLLAALLVPASPKPTTNAQFLGVGAFYYVWYGAPDTDGSYMHWNHSILPHWSAQVRAQHAGACG